MEDKGTEYNKKDPLEWEEVSTEHIVSDEWIDIRRSSYRFPDGNVFEPFYTYSRKDFSVVAATDENGDYICVRQYRQGVRKVTTEFPAGGIERNDGKQYGAGYASREDALLAAKRELAEETGYESDDWSYMLTIPENATIADNYAYIFRARNCRRVSGQKLDDTEFLNVTKHSAAELEKLIADGDFPQAIHIMALLMSQREQ
ncbi:MAG: NUDIX hydrolase [Lachnospiraceae bacterium]|nr:NUDIX hydrolase [Lachnospiraceae bacterium]